jgi:hypothetical protein
MGSTGRLWLIAFAGVCITERASNLSAQVTPPVAVPTASSAKSDSVLKLKRVQLLGVFDERGPADSVEVIDLVGDKTTRTPSSGTIPLGWQSRMNDSSAIQIRKIGYADTVLVLGPKDTTDITVVIRKIATALPTVTTTTRVDLIRDAGMRDGIANRCAYIRVSCVREAELLARPVYMISDFLKRVDGILGGNCNPGRPERCSVSMHSTGAGKCVPTYFLDGHEWSPLGVSALGQIQTAFGPSEIRAIEVYRSEQPKPLRFEGKPGCGSIVIWTK